jgi:hypothetical protein
VRGPASHADPLEENVKLRNAALTAAVCLLALGAPLCTAQEQLPVRAVVFAIQNLTGAADGDIDQLLTDAIRIEIENAGYAGAGGWEKLLDAGEKAPVHGSRAADIARQAGATVAFTGYYTRPDAGSVALSVQCWDAAGQTLLSSFTLSAPFDLGFYNLLHDRLGALVASAEKFTGPPRIEAIEVAEARGLGTIAFLSAQDGVEVLLAGEKSLGTVADGRLDAPVGLLSTGSRLELELRKEGYTTLRTAATAIPEIRLPALVPTTRRSLDLAWNNGMPFGIGGTINWFPVPDWVFVGGTLHVSAQMPGGPGEHVIMHVDAGARAGFYLLPVKPHLSLFGLDMNLPFRVGVMTGFGVIPSFALASGSAAWLDLYLLAPLPFLEIGTKHTIFTLRPDMRYSLGLPGSAIDRGWIMRAVPTDGGTNSVLPIILGVTFKW